MDGDQITVLGLMTNSAKAALDHLLEACENPSMEIRFCLGDGKWEILSGPEFLKRFKSDKSGHLRIDWARNKASLN